MLICQQCKGSFSRFEDGGVVARHVVLCSKCASRLATRPVVNKAEEIYRCVARREITPLQGAIAILALSART